MLRSLGIIRRARTSLTFSQPLIAVESCDSATSHTDENLSATSSSLLCRQNLNSSVQQVVAPAELGIACPGCTQTINATYSYCIHCGTNIIARKQPSLTRKAISA